MLTMRGGTVVDAAGMRRADVWIAGDRIVAVAGPESRAGDAAGHEGDPQVIDCTDRYILPGFVDTHSHADLLLTDKAVQLSLLRQGVTSIIAGQDGVSSVPGDGRYAAEYFAAINGRCLPGVTSVAGYLSAADGTSPLNAAFLVPAGTVRWEVCGRRPGAASSEQVARMAGLVDQGMREGAVGLSTGLDYVPGRFSSAAEITALCRTVARHGGVYVTHMRGGYEAGAPEGIAEVIEIAQATGVPAHVSHFHAQAPIVLGQLDRMAAAGIDATFDAYPYIRGCSLLGMPLLPPEISILPVDEAVRRITDSAVRSRLRRDWFPKVAHYPSLGADWPSMITLAHIAAPEYAWAHGLTLAQAALRAGVDVPDLVLDILAASRLEVNMVMAVRYERPARELAQIFTHPSQMGGSDGIFIGAHPHPRARGTFARYLREYVSELHTWSWSDAVHHLSALPARRFGLGHRGRVVAGAIADLIVVDPERVRDRATYADPVRDAVGIGDVVVAGVQVLAEGELTGATPGRGLRREGACDQRCSTMAPPAEGCPPSATPRPH